METKIDAYHATRFRQFFSFKGRVRRMTFWINTLICGVASIVLSEMFVHYSFSMFTMEERYYVSNKTVYYMGTILIVVRVLSISVRRWQDLEKEGYWAIASFFPILSALFPSFVFFTPLRNVLAIVGSIALLISVGFQGFVPGDDDENSFGPPPEEGQ